MPDGRFLLAFAQPALTWSPTWTRLDDEDNLVASYTIDRGRQFELDQTDTGRAVVEINDRDGVLDPTNPGGPFYGEIESGLQAIIQRRNPISSAWRTRFRGFVEDYDYSFDPSQQVNRLTVSLVDLFERLSTIEMTPRTSGGDGFGDVATSTNKGQVKFVTETCQSRIERVLDHADIPEAFSVVFTGNVDLRQTIYSPGEAAMTAIQEAADAEFPGVSNVFVDRLGRICFHGRLAKFSPAEVAASAGSSNWDYIEWMAGDHAAVVADGTNQTAQIRRFAFNRGLSKVINSALATPFNIGDNDVEGQHVKDAASITEHGVRSWSSQSLITKTGLLDDPPATDLVETKRFAQYYVQNYAQPRNRITEIGFRSMHPDWDGASETWNLLARIDISDSVEVTIDSPGGGGFTGQTFFVEGIHETSRPLNPDYDDVELTLDLSPRVYFTDSPWDEYMPVQNKPIIHGRDHETDGADPIRGLLPTVAGDIEAVILATAPGAYYKLNETSGDWADSADSRPATFVPDDADRDSTRGTNSDYDENDGALSVTVTGPVPAASRPPSHIGIAEDPLFNFAGTSPFTVSARIRLASLSPSLFSMGICGNVLDPSSDARGWGLFVLAEDKAEGGDSPNGLAAFRRTLSGAAVQEVVTVAALEVDVWYRITGTYNGTTAKLYVDDDFHGSSSTPNPSLLTSATYEQFLIGCCGVAEGFGGTMAPFNGEIDSVVVWNRALTDSEVGAIADAAEGANPGEVVVIDPDTGEPVWGPPGTEVEHGDGEEEENPATGPSAGGATNGSGWHYEDHFEYVVLYDSNPGRFDVPSRKWVRVPFNTVRIQRRWESEPGLFVDAWLPDDRGLTEHAQTGVLLVTAGMTFGSAEQEISGWFSIEYPMLDGTQLPNPGGGSPDRYVRAARMTNTTNGSVLRVGGSVDLSYRNFFEWPFSSPAGGDEGRIYFQSDNPYPLYPNSPGRPLNKPLPYPKKTNTDSLDDYQIESGVEGFGLGYFTSLLNLDAGVAISLQAWQDSPWPLRFGTDKYPPFTAQNYRETWRKRPALVLYHRYDPDTVDHDTGLLI